MYYAAVIIGISWIIFWLYWIISALGSKKGRPSKHIRQFISIRIVVIALALILVHVFNRFSLSFKNSPLGSQEAIIVLGLVVFILGISLAVWARVYLGKNWGMPMTEKQDPELVTTGPYTYIRHPIYTGILLMELGSAIDVNTYWLIVLVASAVFFIYSAAIEERLMNKQFPKTYPSYKSRTKALIPFIF